MFHPPLPFFFFGKKKIDSKGSNLFGDGMAMWLTRDRAQSGPVFGSKGQREPSLSCLGGLPFEFWLNISCVYGGEADHFFGLGIFLYVALFSFSVWQLFCFLLGLNGRSATRTRTRGIRTLFLGSRL